MITLRSLTGATETEATQIRGALAALNLIWSSDPFKAAILAHTKLDGSPGFENTDDDCQAVWDKMHSGDVEIDDSVYSPTFWQRLRGNNVVGYEDTDGSVHENRTFLDGAIAAFIADNLAHESMHKLGYEHDFEPTAIRPYSVPYGVGEIVNTLLSAKTSNPPVDTL